MTPADLKQLRVLEVLLETHILKLVRKKYKCRKAYILGGMTSRDGQQWEVQLSKKWITVREQELFND